MANIIDYPDSPPVGKEVTIGTTIKRWDGEKWVNKSFGNHELRLQELFKKKASDVGIFPERFIGYFEDGITFDNRVQLAKWEDGKYYSYIGSDDTPVSVPAGTNPTTSSDFRVVSLNSEGYNIVADGVTDNASAIKEMQVVSRYIELPSGDVYVSEPIILTTGQTLDGLGIANTAVVTDGDYDAVQLGANADFTQVSNLSLRYTGGGQSPTSAAYRPEPTDGGNNHILLNVSISNFKIAMGLGTKWWSSLAINVRCNNCGTDIKCFGLGQAINNTFINFYSNKPTERAIDIRAAKNWTFITPNFGGDAAGVFGSYMQIGTNSKGIKFINPNFEGEGTIAYPEGQSGIEILSNSTVTFDNPTFTTNAGQGSGLSYEIEARDSSTVVVNYPEYISQGANMGRFKAIGSAKVVLTGGSQSDIDDSGSSVNSISVDERFSTCYLAEGTATGVSAGDIIDTGLGIPLKHAEANIVWSGDGRATATVNVSDRFNNGTFKLRFTNLATGGVDSGTFDVYWFAK